MKLNKVMISGKYVDPLVEGGKGVNASNGFSSGAWAACGGVGTLSSTYAFNMNDDGHIKCAPLSSSSSWISEDRYGRFHELTERAIEGGISQINIASKIMSESLNPGALNINVLWECSGIPQILDGILSRVGHLVDGVVCGAGLPFDLAEITSRYNTYYNPIVSSALAFNILWRKSYHKFKDWLGSVVYECPWRAGGHNGISSRENPEKPERTYPRLLKLRQMMNSLGLADITLIIAGGVWSIADWIREEEADLSALSPVAFQFGTRPLLTRESPISEAWKQRLFEIKQGDVKLHRFSPTGYYSSAVNNTFLQELYARSERQVPYATEKSDEFSHKLDPSSDDEQMYIKTDDADRVDAWRAEGYTSHMITPDKTLIFVTREKKRSILRDQMACKGCLNACRFSNFSQYHGSTGRLADPRSFCIANTLDDMGRGGDIDNNLMFAGTAVYKFAQDPLYTNRYIPSTAELYARIIHECEEYDDQVSLVATS